MAVVPDDVFALFPGPDAWDGTPYDSSINSHCMSLSTSDANNAQASQPLFSDSSIQANSVSPFSNPGTVRTPMDTVQVSFNLNTVSPFRVSFDAESVSNTSVSTDGHMCSPTASSFERWNEDLGQDAHQQKRRRRSDTAHSSAASWTAKRGTGRRRASENLEPGSVRAIYLEKNRKAASKCRNKQKMQQEELVVSAHEYERKNRVLKSEVDLLKADMRQLMEVVGQHACCPDKRLQTYVQHEADRLSAKDKDDPVAQIMATKDGFSPGHA